jgi:hypothetical protein
MEFVIPAADSLTRYTVAALRDLALEASAAYDELYTQLSADPTTAAEEDLDRLEALNVFMSEVDDEMDNRKTRQSRFAGLPGSLKTAEAEAEGDEDEDAEEDDADAKPKAAPKAKAAKTEYAAESTGTDVATLPTLSQIAASNDVIVGEVIDAASVEAQFTLIAAPDTGFAAGTELGGWLDVAKAFVNRTASYRGSKSQQQHTVAMVRREFSDEFSMMPLDSDETLKTKLDHLRDEKRLEGGSLTAGVGWCAPSETIYTTCNQVAIDGILSLPEIGARRGGIRHNQGIEFDAIFGAGTGFNILTEAQVIADVAKTCVAIPCPSFVDDRLKVAVLCLTGDILQNRGYPEFVSEFVQGAIAVQAHNVNRQVIADIVTGSTAVSLLGEPFLSDGSVVSNIMSGVDLAVTDIKYRLRLPKNATVQIVLPFWILAQMRADWIRRNAVSDPDLADAAIMSMFRARSAAVDFVYDWQDAFSGVAGNPGDDTPITALPTSVSFLAFPAGTWVLARQDVIRLDSIYDSTNITTNKVTQLFLEDGFRAMRFCPLSRIYSMAVCPSGATGAQREVGCTTP